ncbi:MAG: VanZ family protein [Bacteroidota bacterium]
MHLARHSSLLYQILTILWAAVILVLSTMPGTQLPKIEWLMTPDKFGHAAVYGIFTVGLFYSLVPYAARAGQNRWLSFTIASVYGIAMEVIQYAFFPGRYFEIWDIVANIIGAFAALLFLKLINHS